MSMALSTRKGTFCSENVPTLFVPLDKMRDEVDARLYVAQKTWDYIDSPTVGLCVHAPLPTVRRCVSAASCLGGIDC